MEGFCRGHKYFRHILMSHEIFFKIFDGPRNMFYFHHFIFEVKGVGAQNI